MVRSRVTKVETVVATLLGVALATTSCSETLDAGSSGHHGMLPVDERNPIVLVNDRVRDNWQGEYAVLLANGGGPRLVGIVVDATPTWPNADDNLAGWNDLVTAARSSGLQNIPEPIKSEGLPLVRPPSGDIAKTQPNSSAGALFLLDAARRFSLPYRPLLIATGVPLTDVADAYLIDPTIVERVYVVAALGSVTPSGGRLDSPNGNLDPWAGIIVAQKFHYIQVSAFYGQGSDVPAARLSDLPSNAFGDWMKTKQPDVYQWPQASDQVGVAAVGIPGFVTAVERVSAVGVGGIDGGTTDGLDLACDPKAPDWLVTACDGSAAAKRLWELLLSPKTFTH
jgi:hypothetical protein